MKELTITVVDYDSTETCDEKLSLTQTIIGDHIGHMTIAFRLALLAMGFHLESVNDEIPDRELPSY